MAGLGKICMFGKSEIGQKNNKRKSAVKEIYEAHFQIVCRGGRIEKKNHPTLPDISYIFGYFSACPWRQGIAVKE
jgi:hypothetical protein